MMSVQNVQAQDGSIYNNASNTVQQDILKTMINKYVMNAILSV